MLGGLLVGYGKFFSLAVQFLFPSRREVPWQFVAPADAIPRGQSLTFTAPNGMTVVIKRREAGATPAQVSLDEFIALSSTCPHLGCRVHWEPHNNRFFCPCHNGQFDPEGQPTGGPVLAANQRLPAYSLRIDGGLLFIQIPAPVAGRSDQSLPRAGHAATAMRSAAPSSADSQEA